MKSISGSQKPERKPDAKKLNKIGEAYRKATPLLRIEFVKQVRILAKSELSLQVLQTRFLKFQAYEKISNLPISVIRAGYEILNVETPFKAGLKIVPQQVDFIKVADNTTIKVELFESQVPYEALLTTKYKHLSK